MFVIIALNIAVLGAGGAAFFLGGGGDSSAKENAADEVMMEFDGPPTLVKFKPFIVNLNDAGGSRYLKLGCQIEVPGDKGVEIVENHRAALRHRVILYLSDKGYADIAGKGKKKKMQKALVNELNEELRAPLVRNIYFTEFVVQ
jgi:flagellar FliL protein